jgi:heme exporter protein A
LSASLTLERVSCTRGPRTLFEGVTLALGPGAAAVVTGPNGAGKSSLIRICAGLLSPSAGRVAAAGELALMADALALDPELPLGRALGFWARLDGAAGAIGAALDAVALRPMADAPVRWLSTGQRKRAALARVIASGAPIWLLDEPANGLDTASIAMLEALVAVHRAGGGIALIATHVPLTVPDAQALAL